jgi:phage host-nuclease inhibitor protein Gam
VTYVTIKKLAEIGEPADPITSKSEFNSDIRTITQVMRKMRRNEDTRKARIDRINREFDERAKTLDVKLNPLIDRVFSYVSEHWDELALPTSPKTVYTSSADFKKHVDTRGTKIVDQKTAIEFVQNIDDNPVIIALRKVLGDPIIDAFVQSLKATVTTEVITVIDEVAVKKVSKNYPAIAIDGVEVKYNDAKISMAPHPSEFEKRENIKPHVVERKCPNP